MAADGRTIKNGLHMPGFIKHARSSSPPLLKCASEVIQNGLEAHRIAAQKDENTKTNISINFICKDMKLEKIQLIDVSTNNTGINHFKTGEFLCLYHHKGDTTGFSEYGIGGTYSIMCLTDKARYETKTKNSECIQERTLDLSQSQYADSIYDCWVENEYINSILAHYINDEYTTGTAIELVMIDKFKYSDTYDSIFDKEKLYKNFCKTFINLPKNVNISYTVVDNDKHRFTEHIEPYHISASYQESYYSIMCLHKKTGTTRNFVSVNNIVLNKPSEQKLENIEINDDEKFATYYNNQKIDKFSKKMYCVKTFNEIKKQYKITAKSIHYNMTDVEDTENDIKKCGYYGYREVKGGSKINTTPENSLKFYWNKFSSHRTRYNQFRGIIIYDRDSDTYLQSNSQKTLSDDRKIHPELRWNILSKTNQYFISMRGNHNLYDTNIKNKTVKVVEEAVVEEAVMEAEEEAEEEAVVEAVEEAVVEAVEEEVVEEAEEEVVEEAEEEAVVEAEEEVVEEAVEEAEEEAVVEAEEDYDLKEQVVISHIRALPLTCCEFIRILQKNIITTDDELKKILKEIHRKLYHDITIPSKNKEEITEMMIESIVGTPTERYVKCILELLKYKNDTDKIYYGTELYKYFEKISLKENSEPLSGGAAAC